MGQKSAEDYVEFALEAGKLMQLVDKNIKLIAPVPQITSRDNSWMDWNDYVLTHMAGALITCRYTDMQPKPHTGRQETRQ